MKAIPFQPANIDALTGKVQTASLPWTLYLRWYYQWGIFRYRALAQMERSVADNIGFPPRGAG